MKSFIKKAGIVIKHEYFGSGPVSGLTIAPTSACERLLQNYQLLLKYTADGFDIYRNEEKDPELADKMPPASLAFNFLLITGDAQFSTYTELPSKTNDKMYVFSNVKDKTGFKCTTLPKDQQLNNQSAPFFGMLSLYFSFSKATTLTLNFTAPKLKWKYYVLTGSTFPEVQIDGSAVQINFIKQTTITADDKVGAALADIYTTATLSVFESREALSITNTGRKNIQLRKMESKAIVINHLANPSPEENGIKIINLLN